MWAWGWGCLHDERFCIWLNAGDHFLWKISVSSKRYELQFLKIRACLDAPAGRDIDNLNFCNAFFHMRVVPMCLSSAKFGNIKPASMNYLIFLLLHFVQSWFVLVFQVYIGLDFDLLFIGKLPSWWILLTSLCSKYQSFNSFLTMFPYFISQHQLHVKRFCSASATVFRCTSVSQQTSIEHSCKLMMRQALHSGLRTLFL